MKSRAELAVISNIQAFREFNGKQKIAGEWWILPSLQVSMQESLGGPLIRSDHKIWVANKATKTKRKHDVLTKIISKFLTCGHLQCFKLAHFPPILKGRKNSGEASLEHPHDSTQSLQAESSGKTFDRLKFPMGSMHPSNRLADVFRFRSCVKRQLSSSIIVLISETLYLKSACRVKHSSVWSFTSGYVFQNETVLIARIPAGQ